MKLIRHANAPAAAVLAVTLMLAGCAGQTSDYDSKAADRLQSEVLEVSQLAAAADYSAAMLGLAELEAELKDALARGAITAERYESVMAALTLVRADLQAAIDEEAPPVTEDPATVDAGDNEGTGNNGEGNNGNNGNGNNGKGNGKDKGKD